MKAVIQPRFDAGRYLELIAEHRVVLSYAVPSMLLLALDHPSAGDHDYGSLLGLMYGTAPMPPGGVRRLGTLFPNARLINVYGLTEGGGTVCSLSRRRPRSGRTRSGVPRHRPSSGSPGGTARRRTPEQVGEIWMRSDTRRSYFRDEEASRETWTRDGWLRTGDLGYVDADGFLYLADRKKDMIIRGGFNVYAVEIEAVLHEHSAVAEAAVVGIPHPVLGEDVGAFVVPRAGEPVTAEELEAFCRDRLADYKCPRRIELLDELPRNALGKVLKRDLRDRAAREERAASA